MWTSHRSHPYIASIFVNFENKAVLFEDEMAASRIFFDTRTAKWTPTQ